MGFICNYCNSKNVHFVNEIDQYNLYSCRECLLLQTEVSKDKIKSINSLKYNDEYLDNYVKIRGTQLVKDFQSSIREIETFYKGGTILDVGCGVGLFLDTLLNFSSYSWDMFGIDINSKSINKAFKSIQSKLTNISINYNNFEDNFFDVITCFDVIEHSANLSKLLFELRRILKKNALLVIQVPNSDSLMRQLTGNDWDWWCVPDHTFHFTPLSINKILYEEGFKIIKIRTWEHSNIFIKNIQGHIRKILPHKYLINRFVAKILYLPLFLLWLVINKLLQNYKKGGLIYLIAQKQ